MSNILLQALIDALFAAIVGVGFAFISNSPKRILPFVALLAAISHSSRFIIIYFNSFSIVIATLFASFLAGILGMFFAKKIKVPAEIIAFPSLLPMIPGNYAYKSILALFSFINSTDDGQKIKLLMVFFDNALSTIGIALALGVGVSMTLLIFYEQSFMMTRRAHLKFTKKRKF